AGILCPGARAQAASAAPDSPVKAIRTVAADAGRVSWAQDKIVFDRKNKDDYYDIWTMKADGTDQKCLTCYMCPLPEHGHKSNPDWDQSGQYIVFQGENRYEGTGNAGKCF